MLLIFKKNEKLTHRRLSLYLIMALALILASTGLGRAVTMDDKKLRRFGIEKVPDRSSMSNDKRVRYKKGEILVTFKPGTKEGRKNQFHQRHGLKKLKEFRYMRTQRLKLKKGQKVEDAIALYRNDPDVEHVEPNFCYRALAMPNDPNYSQLWGMNMISAPTAWDMTTGSNTVVVGIIDGGIDYTHPDLALNIWSNPGEIDGNGIDDDGNGYLDDIYGIDTANQDSDPFDDHGHGTHVAGTIGAVGHNSIGVAGVNWNIQMVACKFIDSTGYGYTDGAIECLEYFKALKDSGVNIVATNNSWGGDDPSQALADAIDAQRDILFIAAAGNDYDQNNDKRPAYPASHNLPNILSVAATNSSDEKPFFSNLGRRTVHLGAPGESIFSSVPAQNTWNFSGGYGALNGTSMASPHVAGLAALLKAQNPSRDWREIKNLILTSGDDVADLDGITLTGKRINAANALACTDMPIFSVKQLPKSLTVGVPTTLSALSLNCGTAVGPVTATTATSSVISLLDDGVFPDLAAGDGLFTASWTPTRTGERLDFSSSSGSESVAAPPLALQSTYLPTGNIQALYNQTIEVIGGLPPYAWTLPTPGDIPTGLTLGDSTGIISGTPQNTGFFTFAVQITDSLGSAITKSLAITVSDDMVVEEWGRVHDFGHEDWLYGMDVDAQGNAFVSGDAFNTNNSTFDINTVKYNSSGQEVWSRTYHRMDTDVAFAVKVDMVGNIYAVGRSDYDLIILKYNQAGTLLFDKIYDGGGWDVAWAATFDQSNNLFLLGQSSGQDSIFKFDENGNLIWVRALSEFGGASYQDFVIDGSGNYYVTGRTDNSMTADALIIKYDAAGNSLWTKIYARGNYDSGLGLALDGSGNLLVAGISSAVDNDYLFLKYDPSGTLLWEKIYDSGEPDHLSGFATDSSNNIYVTGELSGDFRTTKFDSTGNVEWTKVLGAWVEGYGYDGNTHDPPFALSTGPDGTVYVAGWTGNGSDSDYLTVKYSPLGQNTLSYTQAGNGSGSVDFTPGSTCFSDCDQYYVTGTQVTLIATPSSDTLFTGWSGACSGTGSCMVTMNSGQNVTANFTLKPALNLIQLGTGSGTVDFAPGSSCSGDCTQYYDSGTQVTLTVTASPDSVFTGWGGACSGTGSCMVTMDSDQNVTANFTLKPAINLTQPGTGNGTVDFNPGSSCSGDCTQYYDSGTQVTLTATASPDSIFTGWSGACSGTGTCMVTMNGDQNVTADFTLKPTLTLTHLGTGGGTVDFNPGASCTDNCSQYYDSGTQVTLTATPDVRSALTGWGGACSGTGTCMVTMNSDEQVTVNFINTSPFVTQPAIVGGSQHTVALTSAGDVWAWGGNSNGQLGDGTTTFRTTPALVSGISGVKAIAAGYTHTLALKEDGTLWAWGANSQGQLGDGTTTQRLTPVQVSGISDVVALAGGLVVHSLAVKADGTAWSWGGNAYGQLGDGFTNSRLTPGQIPGLSGIQAIDSGYYFSAALDSDGNVWAWGLNSSGSLGDGTTIQRNAPILVPNVNSVVAFATGWNQTITVTDTGTLWAWGHNMWGQIGDGTTTTRYTPVQVPGFSEAMAIANKGTTNLCLKTDGNLWAWGKNDYGQIGDGTTTTRYAPVEVSGLVGVAAIGAGTGHSLAVRNDGTIWVWGNNSSGQLGIGTTTNSSVPVEVTGLILDVSSPTTIASPPGGSYCTTKNVTLVADEPATIRYTLDGSDPTAASPIYSTPLTIATTTTLRYFATDPAGNAETIKEQIYTFLDSDGDGLCDLIDTDDDNDGCDDSADIAPLVFSTDTDGDGFGSDCDAFPADYSEWLDADGDGVGDNSDICDLGPNGDDADLDGVPDSCDGLANTPDEWKDTDGDGIGDNADNCVRVANPGQFDGDDDALGDACDTSGTASFGSVLDAPHNQFYGISCSDCHTYSIWWQYSPMNTGDSTYGSRTDLICSRCHGTGVGAISIVHSADAMGGRHNTGYGDWTTRCVDCHDPHYQAQLDWRTDDSANLYLATGTIGNSGGFSVNNTGLTTFEYTNLQLSVNNPTWDPDFTDWGKKDSLDLPSGLILVEDTAIAKNTFEIISIDTGALTVTVKGGMDPASEGSTFGVIYGRMIKSSIDTQTSGTKAVKFYDPNIDFDSGIIGGLVDPVNTAVPEGLCQVCHVNTTNWMNSGSGTIHNSDTACITCHFKKQGFRP